MKTKSFFFIFACVLLAGVWFFWHERASKRPESPTDMSRWESNSASSTVDSSHKQENVVFDATLAPTSSTPRTDARENGNALKIPPRGASEEDQAAFLRSLGLQGNRTEDVKRSFTLYGEVIDESNAPVQSVKIFVEWNEPPPAPPESANTVSDESGRFAADVVTGRFLRVSLDKEGYYVSRSNQLVLQFSPDENQPAPHNPLIYHLRKKGPGADLITSNVGTRDYVSVKVPKDGTPVWLDLFNRRFGNEGQIVVSNVKPLDGRERSDWSFTISVPSGGLLEHHDEFPFEAPIGGYQPAVEFRFEKNSTNWVPGFAKDFYIVFGQPRNYGRIHVETDTFMSGAHIEYAINPDGSRCLEPK